MICIGKTKCTSEKGLLVVVFSNIILQKHVLDAAQSFPSSHVWNERPSFQRKIL